jgi:hypothetical protein
VLLVFFFIICVLIPFWFYRYFSQEEKDIGGINKNNREIFNDLIDENMLSKNLPSIIG